MSVATQRIFPGRLQDAYQNEVNRLTAGEAIASAANGDAVNDAPMRDVTTLFWDIGGVILSNGWDESARDEAARRFHLDRDDFERRHADAFPDFETGRATLDVYLDRTIFFAPRPFSREDVKAFVFGRSSEETAARAVLDEGYRDAPLSAGGAQ